MPATAAAVAAAGDGEQRGGDGGWSVDRGQGPEAVGVPGAPLPRDPVEAVLRGRPVRPVRIRDTTTTLVRLHGRDGRLRAEVADVRVDEGDRDTALLRSARWWALTDDGDPGQIVRAVERAVTDAADDDGRAPGDPVPTLAPVRRPVTGGSERPRPGSAAAFVRGVLAPLRTELLTVDPRVRARRRRRRARVPQGPAPTAQRARRVPGRPRLRPHRVVARPAPVHRSGRRGRP